MIRKLPQHVINKIAAGQVIQRPVNALKELIQNSIDAGANKINVTINQGGIKLLKIVDNGKGILAQDFPLLCARFATSKISQLTDLQSLGSFGFRGQALASLSYVSHLQVSSRHQSQNIGHTAYFKNEKIEDGPIEATQNIGTKITATNLFITLQTRRQSLNPSQEKKKIIKLMNHFCLHYSHIQFSLESEKGNEQLPKALKSNSSSQAKMAIFQQITKLSYDKMTYIPKHEHLGTFQIEAIVTKLNACKGKTLLLNINNRIIENSELFKAIEKGYSEGYQSIHAEMESFYVYLSLWINPKSIDCNVHPTKKNVSIFGGREIYDHIKDLIVSNIQNQSVIKTIKSVTQTPLITDVIKSKLNIQIASQTNFQAKQTPKSYDYNKKRTDNTQLPLHFFTQKNISQSDEKLFRFRIEKTQQKIPLTNRIKQLFVSLSYVGCVGLNSIFVQKNNRLLTMNVVPYIKGYVSHYIQTKYLLFKQVQNNKYNIKQIISRFIHSHPHIRFSVQEICSWLDQNHQWLQQTYGVRIHKQYIEKYPCINEVFVHYVPVSEDFLEEFAYFICRIYDASVKNNEQSRRSQFLNRLICAQFQTQSDVVGPFNDKYNKYLENLIIPSLKTKTYHEEPMKEDNIRQLLDLKDIYKIFERC